MQLPGKWCFGLLSCPRQVVLLFSNTWSGQWGQRDSSLPWGTGPLQRYHRASPLPWGRFLEVHEQQKLKSRFFLMQMLKKGSRNLKRREEETSGQGGSSQSPAHDTASLLGRLGMVPSPETVPQAHSAGAPSQYPTPVFCYSAPLERTRSWPANACDVAV